MTQDVRTSLLSLMQDFEQAIAGQIGAQRTAPFQPQDMLQTFGTLLQKGDTAVPRPNQLSAEEKGILDGMGISRYFEDGNLTADEKVAIIVNNPMIAAATAGTPLKPEVVAATRQMLERSGVQDHADGALSTGIARFATLIATKLNEERGLVPATPDTPDSGIPSGPRQKTPGPT